jgi:DNA-binding MarR family transcriptional regulator
LLTIPGAPPDPEAVADRLHSAAIHLLRRVRAEDAATGVTPAQLSALSVLVFGGPRTVSALAEAEQVALPTISRLVGTLERDGLVRRRRSDDDRRAVIVTPTRRAQRLLREGRRRRVQRLAGELERLPDRDLRTLARAAEILARLES